MKQNIKVFISLLALIILAIILLALSPVVWLFDYCNHLMKEINEDINQILR